MIDAPIDDRDGWIWLNGEFVPWREAKIHTLTHGLHYGGSVFEGERMYDGQIFKMREHSDRLINSANLLDIPLDITADELDGIKMDTLKKNNMTDDCYVRAFVWRGSEVMGLNGMDCKTNIAVAYWPWGNYYSDKGIALQTSDWRRPDPSTYPVQAKAAGLYAVNSIVKHKAIREGYDDALMLDTKGQVAEASVCNIFCINKMGEIKTPIPDCFLNGITRQTIIQAAKDLDMPIEETRIMPDELDDFVEIFVTGTAAEVTAISRIDDKDYSVGPVTRKLQEAYKDIVRTKYVAQAKTA
jgi:branched-chain amino acid aminotransferase